MDNERRKKLAYVLVCLSIIGTIFLLLSKKEKEPMSFRECLDLNYPIMESYPRQCNAGGKSFVEDIGNAVQKSNLIILENPKPNAVLGNKISLYGSARGYWFFEATFPIDVFDGDGKLLGQGYAQAKSEWMTENFVPFEAEINLTEVPQNPLGTLVLRKDNPSGDSIRDDSLIVPVFLKLTE